MTSQQTSAALRAAALLACACTTAPVFAQVTKPDGQWYGSVGAGLSVSSAATRNTTANFNAAGARETRQDKIVLGANALFGESTDAAGVKTKTAEQFLLGGRYEWNVSEAVYAFGLGELAQNRPADVKLRQSLGGGAGHTSTDFYNAASSSGAELLIGEEGNYKLSSTSSLRQRIVVYPSLKESGEYRATLDTTLSAAIAGGWNLQATLGVRYNSLAPAGTKKTESLFLVGLGYSFGPK
jgi:putative salt-induced outer membrane protein YdiY